jgi:hypothetical protein
MSSLSSVGDIQAAASTLDRSPQQSIAPSYTLTFNTLFTWTPKTEPTLLQHQDFTSEDDKKPRFLHAILD